MTRVARRETRANSSAARCIRPVATHNSGVAISLPVIVVLDNIRSLYNTGAFFRTAGGCAAEKLVLCGITPRPDQGGRQRRSIAKTALGAELAVRWEYEAERVVQSIPLLDD